MPTIVTAQFIRREIGKYKDSTEVGMQAHAGRQAGRQTRATVVHYHLN
jgi:hypothetical protein